MKNKRIFIALFLVICMTVTLLLSSCAEDASSVIKTIQNDPTTYTKDTAVKTLQSICATSPAYESAKNLSKNGTFEFKLNSPDVSFNLDASFKGDDIAIVIKNPDELSASFYISKDSVTLDLTEAMDEGKVLTIAKNAIKDIITDALHETRFQISDRAELFGELASACLIIAKSVELIKPTVSEESVTVGGKQVDCIAVSYNIDTTAFKTMLSYVFNELEAENLIEQDTLKSILDTLLIYVAVAVSPDSYLTKEPIEVDSAKLFDVDYIIKLFNDAGLAFKSITSKAYTSKDDGRLVYSDFDLKIDFAGKESFLSLKTDLGSTPSLYEDKTISLSFDIASFTGNAEILWDADNSPDKLICNLKIDASVSLPHYGAKITSSVNVLDLKLEYAKDSGKYTLSCSSSLRDFLLKTGIFPSSAFSTSFPEKFEISGTFKYSNESIELNVDSIKAMEQEFGTETFSLNCSFKQGCVFPKTPQAQKINNYDDLIEAFGILDKINIEKDMQTFKSIITVYYYETAINGEWNDYTEVLEALSRAGYEQKDLIANTKNYFFCFDPHLKNCLLIKKIVDENGIISYVCISSQDEQLALNMKDESYIADIIVLDGIKLIDK